MSEEIRLLDSQVSGKNAKFTDSNGLYIYKKLSQSQFTFYLYMNNLQIHQHQFRLKKFIPRYEGKKIINTSNVVYNPQDMTKKSQWIFHISERNMMELQTNKEFIVLENLTFNFQYVCSVDIKLGRKRATKSSNKKFQKSTTNSHHFRINGMSNFFVQQRESYFISKYYFQTISEQEIQNHLSFFFFDGQNLDIQLIRKCVEEVKDIVLALQSFKAGKFESASLFICYDAYHHQNFKVKLIDFDKYELTLSQQSDQNIIVGLKYIVEFLNSICDNSKNHEEVIREKNLGLFKNYENIPKQKMQQFRKVKSEELPAKRFSSVGWIL